VGIIGYGRIGKLVFKKLSGFGSKILVNDIDKNQLKDLDKTNIASLKKILNEADIITIHIPLTKKNKHFISKKQLMKMKKNAVLINTARGEIVNNKWLYDWLKKNPHVSAAIDVFKIEPYNGKLKELKNCYLTPHAGSCTEKSRYLMEVRAVKNAIKFIEENLN
jgi:phosphoglycerate dehydrogenase-like enzyme